MSADAAFWNAIAEKYARKPLDNPDAFERKIAITKARMTPRDVVLDIGCGTGSLALRLAPHAAQIHGLDVSSEMIRIARQKAEAAKATNVTFHEGVFDEGFTAFAPGSLDGICAYNLVHLLDDRPALLNRVFALLKPGGFFVSSTACLGNSWVPYRPLLWVMRRLGKAPKVAVFSRQTLERELAQAGFVKLERPDVGAKPTMVFIVASKPDRSIEAAERSPSALSDAPRLRTQS